MAEEKARMALFEMTKKPSGLGVRHFQIMMMCLCATIIYIIRSSMGAAILAMTDVSQANNTRIEIYNWSEEVRGVILSSFFWGYTITQIPAGILCKQYGGNMLLTATLLINGILCLSVPILAKIGGWIAVCMVRVCMGLTQSCFMPAVHTLLGEWAPPQERTSLTIIAYAGIQMGTIITMAICGILSSTFLGWTLIFYSVGTLSLVTSVVFWMLTSSKPREHRFIKQQELDYIENSLSSKSQEIIPIPWRQILTSKPLYAIQVAHIGGNWCFVIFLVQIPTYLMNALNINLINSAMLSALPFAAQWIMNLVMSFISDYMINKNILSVTSCRKLFNTFASVGAAVGLVLMSFLTSENKNLAIVILTVTVGISGANTCGYMLNHLDLSPRFGGVMYAITNCVANLVGILGPLSTGFILGDSSNDISRWRIVFFIAATIILTSDIVYRLFGSCELQAWNEPLTATYNMGHIKECTLVEKSIEGKEEITFKFQEKHKDVIH